MNKDIAPLEQTAREMTPLECRIQDNASEAKTLLAAHDNTLRALATFQKENAKGDETRIHPAEYAHMVLAEYAKTVLE